MKLAILTGIFSMALLAAMFAIYKLWGNLDDILDMVADLATAIEERDKKLTEMQQTLDEAKDLIEVTKEVTEEQLKTEKAFRKGIENIFNY